MPFGSSEDLGLFWNVAVSNILQTDKLAQLDILVQGEVIEIPGGLILSSGESLLEYSY